MADIITATVTINDNINVNNNNNNNNNNNQLFIIKALTQQPEDQLQAQQKNVRENT